MTSELKIPTNQADLAYAAGIFDGEGCFYARVRIDKEGRVGTYILITLGGDIYTLKPVGTHKKIQYSWQVRGSRVAVIAEALSPFLKEKAQRAQLIIDLANSIKANNYKPLTDESIAQRSYLAAAIKQFNRSGETAA